MRALTICQPYATLIMSGAKRVENRTWETKYRGRLYIHAGKSREWLSVVERAGIEFDQLTMRPVLDLPFGAVIGVATLVDCLLIEEILAGKHDARFPWLREHEHTKGPWCWVFAENPTPIGPFPYKGAQGLFDIHADTLSRIESRTLGVKEQ